jgi:hypothetical protein
LGECIRKLRLGSSGKEKAPRLRVNPANGLKDLVVVRLKIRAIPNSTKVKYAIPQGSDAFEALGCIPSRALTPRHSGKNGGSYAVE